MNHLAHLVLADPEPASIIGNLAGDFVKGPIDLSWPAALREGVQLHRRIDSYTDAHAELREVKNLFSRARRRFAGVILDVAFDHFLSCHWQRYVRPERREFIDSVYAVLTDQHHNLPADLRRVAPIMIRRDWLARCESLQGTGQVLDRIATRSHRTGPLRGSIEEVQAHYPALEASFLSYFPQALQFAEQEKARLSQTQK